MERKLGIDNSGPSDSKSDKKRRLDDTEYLEQSREIVDGVKNAVSTAMLKKTLGKRKKARTDGTGSDKSGIGGKKPEPEEKATESAAVAASVDAEALSASIVEPPLSAVGA